MKLCLLLKLWACALIIKYLKSGLYTFWLKELFAEELQYMQTKMYVYKVKF